MASQDQTWSKLDKLYKLGKSEEQIEQLDISIRNKDIEQELNEFHKEKQLENISNSVDKLRSPKCKPLRNNTS